MAATERDQNEAAASFSDLANDAHRHPCQSEAPDFVPRPIAN